MARKTEFELIAFEKENGAKVHGKAHIIKEKEPFVPRIEIKIETGHIQRKGNLTLYLQYRDLERFAVNILKAMGSKKLAFSQRYNSKTFFAKKKKH